MDASTHGSSGIWMADVGHGHTKFGIHGGPRFSIPSQVANGSEASYSQVRSEVLYDNDIRTVKVGDKPLVVGPDVANVMPTDTETEVLGPDYSNSDTYAALLYGAMAYMLDSRQQDEVEMLALGLPVSAFASRHERLAKRFTDKHVVDTSGRTVTVRRTVVFPQPLGGYATYLASLGSEAQQAPTALIVDPGYGTVDWFVCKGMHVLTARCGDVKRGMGAVLRAIADALIKENDFDATPSETVRQIDRALRERQTLRMYGREIDMDRYSHAGASIIEEAANAVRNSIGSGADVDAIVMVGGGAEFYASAIQERFKSHAVHVLDDPAYANVTGYGLLARMLSQSAKRAALRAV